MGRVALEACNTQRKRTARRLSGHVNAHHQRDARHYAEDEECALQHAPLQRTVGEPGQNRDAHGAPMRDADAG